MGMDGKRDNGRNITSYLATFVDVGGRSEQTLGFLCLLEHGSKDLLSWFIDTWTPEVAYSE